MIYFFIYHVHVILRGLDHILKIEHTRDAMFYYMDVHPVVPELGRCLSQRAGSGTIMTRYGIFIMYV